MRVGESGWEWVGVGGSGWEWVDGSEASNGLMCPEWGMDRMIVLS